MTEREILKAAMLNAPALSRLSGVSVDTIRAILKPSTSESARRPRPATRAKLAAALRAHSQTLASLADQLEPPD